jgi:transcriptional regulator GlxA family with amidase domain
LPEIFSLDEAAAALATSKRTLERRMQSVLGKSPLDYFQDLRVERAVHLLEASQAGVDQIAVEGGFRRREAAHVAAPRAWPRRSRNPPRLVV